MRKISLNGLFCPKSFEIKQLLRAMKITLFLLLFVTFQAYCGNSYSQNAKVNIPSSQLRVGQVLSQIESQTEYLFVYNKKSVDVRRTVNVEAEGKSVAELLDEVFAGTSIKYVMEGKNIVLTKKSENTENTDGVQQERVTVKGVVTDSKGEPIIGANILEKGTTNGIITNLDGEFTLNAPANATLVISYIGYEPISIALNGRTSLKVQMKEEALALETVVVTAMGIKKKEASLTYSRCVYHPQRLRFRRLCQSFHPRYPFCQRRRKQPTAIRHRRCTHAEQRGRTGVLRHGWQQRRRQPRLRRRYFQLKPGRY